jgi:hypothetical protein
MATQQDADLRRAIQIAHYHLALLEHPDWAARAHGRSRILGVRVPPLSDALDILQTPAAKEHAHAHHANAVLARIHNLTYRKPVDGVPDYLSTVMARETLEGLEPEMAFGDALGAAYGRALGIRDLEFVLEPISGVDAEGVTHFYAGVSFPAEQRRFAKLAAESDPRLWHTQFPEMFKDSYDAGPYAICPRRDVPPAPATDEPPDGQSFSGRLYERFGMGLFGEDLIVYRNLLSIDFARDDATSKMALRYALFESLVTEIYGIQYSGGIDVDSNLDAAGEVTWRDGRMTVKAGKSIRLSDEIGCYQFELNMISLPFLAVWITGMLLKAAADTAIKKDDSTES